MDFDREEAIISRALDTLEQNVETPDLMPGIERRLGKKPRRHRRALCAALIIPALRVLKIRFQEIEGGELDAASQY